MESTQPPSTAVIACRVLEEEVRHFSAGLSHLVAFEFLEMGLHDRPDKLRSLLKAAIARIEAEGGIDAIALVYGVCGMATVGLAAQRCRLVLPRAHDCITLLLGSKERYAELMRNEPGRYWYSPGWNREKRVPSPEREAALRAVYAEKFGAEEAEALLEMERASLAPHARASYVDLGLQGNEADRRYAESCASWLGWPCEAYRGDATLLRDLLAGKWDANRFLVVQPGHAIRFIADETIVGVVPQSPAP
jgi:hypothetical protein